MKMVEMGASDAAICDRLNALVPELSERAPVITIADLERIISSEGGSLFVAMDQGEVVGCVMLTVFPVLTDIRGWIDDLLVRSSERRQGVGRKLVDHAMRKAKAMVARSVNLTCNPHRISANALYRGMGFKQREANVYRLKC